METEVKQRVEADDEMRKLLHAVVEKSRKIERRIDALEEEVGDLGRSTIEEDKPGPTS